MKKYGIFVALFFLSFSQVLFFSTVKAENQKHNPGEIRAVYLGSPHIFSEKKISELEKIITATSANAVVIDYKDSNNPNKKHITNLVRRFKKNNAYTIARIVVFQDTYFVKQHPQIAVKTSNGELWWSGRKTWRRYWVDPASELGQNYNIQVAKEAINCGFDELQFDYIRFPTDGPKDIRYPVFNPTEQTKDGVMESFFAKLRTELKVFAPKVLIGIDVFGMVFLNGKEAGIGQNLSIIAGYFDVICDMAYPSHYRCGEFKVQDPTAHPYEVYYITHKNALKFLDKAKIIIRPWIQDFSIRSIYGCGPAIVYGKDKVLAQIQACRDLGINGFMLWNANSNFTSGVFDNKPD